MRGCIPSLSHTPQLKTRKITVAKREGKSDIFSTLQLTPENERFERECVSKFPACIPFREKENHGGSSGESFN
jgi:hypothetical protein